jgi:hypothetical protein
VASLGLWTLLAPLGTLPEGAMVGPTARAWYEELRLAPVVADALRSRGLDEAAAWWAAERVRLLLDLPLPSTLEGTPESVAASAVDAWLFHPVARPFLRVNRWDGQDWFHGESLAELLTWVDRLEAILAPAGATAEASVRRLAQASAVRALIEAAVAASGYRVDRLRDALAPDRELLAEPAAGAEADEADEDEDEIEADEPTDQPEPVAAVAAGATPEPPAKAKKKSKKNAGGKGKSKSGKAK